MFKEYIFIILIVHYNNYLVNQCFIKYRTLYFFVLIHHIIPFIIFSSLGK